MAVLKAFCSVCNREVHLVDGQTLVCPVCSSPLIETGGTDLDEVVAPYPPVGVGPEIFLG